MGLHVVVGSGVSPRVGATVIVCAIDGLGDDRVGSKVLSDVGASTGGSTVVGGEVKGGVGIVGAADREPTGEALTGAADGNSVVGEEGAGAHDGAPVGFLL